jgi:hypothetical protein
VREELETASLRSFVQNSALVSCELILTELPRAIHRASFLDPALPVKDLIQTAGEVIDAVALMPLDRSLLSAAGALAEPRLRALDAIHVCAAILAFPHDGFITYDERQSAAAGLAGMRTFAPHP